MKTIVPEGYKKTKAGVIPNDWQLYRTDKVLKRVRNSVDVIADEEYKQIGIRSHGKGIFYKEKVTGKELGNKSVFFLVHFVAISLNLTIFQSFGTKPSFVS